MYPWKPVPIVIDAVAAVDVGLAETAVELAGAL